ncbi:MAG: hypothetical protein KIG64_03190 [Bacteroidales bacterium]|nr:hypothetical protein [Bacteroidales bacterium]
MDIELLSRMVAELIVKNDSVGLPGMGSFVAEIVPASFSDRGYSITPPYRKLSFRGGYPTDSLLVDYYAKSNGTDKEEARSTITDYVIQMKSVLKERKTIIFPGLGKLRATKDNTFFFVPDENLDIYPDGITLQPISLKTHSVSSEELARAVSSISELIAAQPKPAETTQLSDSQDTAEVDQPAAEQPAADPQPEVAVQPGPSEQPVQVEQPASDPQPEVGVQPGPSEQPVLSDQPAQPAQAEQPAATTIDPEPDNGKSKRWWIWPLVVLGLVIVALAVFMILGRTAPDLIDPLLYTPEELRIINY